MGRSAIVQHQTFEKHKRAFETVVSSSQSISSFFSRKTLRDGESKLAALEGAFAYHTIYHGQSFRSLDCTTQLLKVAHNPRFTCGRTKAQALVSNVFLPHFQKELRKDLSNAHFVTAFFDAFNHGATKLIPILIRYFNKDSGVCVKILDIEDVKGETSELLTDLLIRKLSEFEISQKIVCLSADNTNTNFGGVARKGRNNVFARLNSALDTDLIGSGCIAHIINNCMKRSADSLPVDLEVVLIKIFGYFQHYTVRVTKLKEFCESIDVEYKNVLSYCGTRWLSLLPSLERILQIFQPLKERLLFCRTVSYNSRRVF